MNQKTKEVPKIDNEEFIEILGARVHNLKNIDLKIPRDKLVVITGLSGSGKSSLAFDTIFAEGQRRYLETFNAYARQFLGNLERPDVDKISGLSPVIAIEQKTVSKNPRSTVGTITEIYDFLRLLYARVSTAYSPVTGKPMIRYSEAQIIEAVSNNFKNEKISILAPLVKGRKGHYKELFVNLRKQGYLKVRVDGQIKDLSEPLRLDRYKIHDIELIIDRLDLSDLEDGRLANTIRTALKLGKGLLMVLPHQNDQLTHFSKFLMCPESGISYPEPEPNLFSFNSPYGYCNKCHGLGEISQVDIDKVIPNRSLSIKQGALEPLGEYKSNWFFKQIETLLANDGFKISTPVKELPEELLEKILWGEEEALNIKSGIGLGEYAVKYEGVVKFIERQAQDNPSKPIQRWAEKFSETIPCPACNGARLNEEALNFKLDGKNISEVAKLDIADFQEWINTLEAKLSDREKLIGTEVIKEIKARTEFLCNVGLTYLTLDRSAKSLSGGEAQRIRLATQIGSQLVSVLYILDEPSIGLHQRDNERLINSLKQLRDLGNSVLVVEHDKDMILAADYVIDIGPGAGKHGGVVIAQGSPEEIKNNNSITAQYLSNEKRIEPNLNPRPGIGKNLILKGATGHNLKNVTLDIPLGKFVCITGVSGSGKSSLVNQTLYPILSNHFYRSEKSILPYKEIKGLEHLDKVIEIDQSPIGRTTRSNPATYTGVFNEIRNLFSITPEAKIRGYKPGRFSFNTPGGRCETCKGAGIRSIEMNFLPDVYVVCETCNGKRYNRETLDIRYKGKSISDVLDMTIENAAVFFKDIPKIARILETLNAVGLGYLSLGQQSTTLSGGEAQRIKLATELSKRETGSTIYILDEPTTGLHFQDIKHLIDMLNQLADNGNTVIVIEHNLDLIKVADHIIDVGPEGGKHGGKIVATGTPAEIAKHKTSFTGQYLKNELFS
ncbi:MAG: excinuclease ABC subunit UvrA [Luteibaculaceae bacterium]